MLGLQQAIAKLERNMDEGVRKSFITLGREKIKPCMCWKLTITHDSQTL